jgi:hypothetical protein
MKHNYLLNAPLAINRTPTQRIGKVNIPEWRVSIPEWGQYDPEFADKNIIVHLYVLSVFCRNKIEIKEGSFNFLLKTTKNGRYVHCNFLDAGGDALHRASRDVVQSRKCGKLWMGFRLVGTDCTGSYLLCTGLC